MQTPKTEEELKELLSQIIFNRGDFAPSLVVKKLAEVCAENAELPQMDQKEWRRTATVLTRTIPHII
jgi:hypothetical protein